MSQPSPHTPSGGGHTGTGAGAAAPSDGGHESPAMQAFFAMRQRKNEHMMKMYAAALCGLVALFVVFHWTRWLCVRAERSWRPLATLGRPFVAIERFVRSLLVRKVPGFKSAGHALLVTTYVVANVAVGFTNVDASSKANFASRFGRLALSNLGLVIFLALKNTPLAFLTAYSYERLNCLHRIAGYTMFIWMVLHASLYTTFFSESGMMVTKFKDRTEIAAIVAGFSFLTVVLSATILRRIWYELFYVVHISSWIMGIVALGFHQPVVAKKGIIVILLVASMWVLDHLIRITRVLYYSLNNEATLYPLPDGGTKVIFKKAPARAAAGKHCFIWIPAVRKFEMHPFTIHKTNSLEFTIKAQNGFTRDLHQHAVANPGISVRASLDGPYGTFPDPMDYDKIVLIAGGGGATFTFGLVANILERLHDEPHKTITFIWAVKKHENLAWFKEHLEALKSHAHSPKVDVSIYVTRSPVASQHHHHLPHIHGHSLLHHTQPCTSESSSGGSSPPLSPDSGGSGSPDTEKMSQLPLPIHTHQHQNHQSSTLSEKDLEHGGGLAVVSHHSKAADNSTGTESHPHPHHAHGYEHAIKPGRPDMATLIRQAVVGTPSNQRVLVAACGPDGLMRVVRDTTARLIQGDGPGVELHCEQFGW
ncbi:ferric reductase NAD binding domain-containing protein [Neurospora tetraspora]|uniref:Ferric reductase NAD binding domain-containing protein n=1 Tax=Neurospora tetraspora TaxID=94610 RepID=A0AAE0JD55_9PEZI|nr:ferric reductase NAD binding domain-containing protein [Neurospora tetraspora]